MFPMNVICFEGWIANNFDEQCYLLQHIFKMLPEAVSEFENRRTLLAKFDLLSLD